MTPVGGTPSVQGGASSLTPVLAEIVETSTDLVGVLAGDGAVRYLNGAARELVGLTGEVPDGLTHLDLFTAASAERVDREVWPTLRRHRAWVGDLDLVGADGAVVQAALTLAAELDSAGDVDRVTLVARDVTTEKRTQVELAHRATHDALTGLPNRALLMNHLQLALARSTRGERSVAVLFVDVDGLKQVNDRFGHDAGDDLINAVARLLRRATRPADTVARFGGDEFVVLCPDVDGPDDAAAIGRRVTAVFDESVVTIGGVSHQLRVSIGIAVSGPDTRPDGILRDADTALYRVKAQGGHRFALFDEEMRRTAISRQRLSDELGDAIADRRIVPYYQPAVDLASGTIVALEALARWRHPDRGTILAPDFIGIAEDTGLIEPLGDLVFDQVVSDVETWRTMVGDDVPEVHLNLSPTQLASDDVIDRLVAGLADSRWPERTMVLEIGEEALVQDRRAVERRLQRLRQAGFGLAIDDFGTGPTSLRLLPDLRVDVLKVDRSFVRRIGADPSDRAIVHAILRLADDLSITTIAEGVETDEQLAELRHIGCGVAQGFLFAPALPADELTPLLIAGRRRVQGAGATPELPIQLA